MWARCCISWALGGKGRLWWMRYKVRHRKWTVGFWNEKSAGPTEKLDLWDRSGPLQAVQGVEGLECSQSLTWRYWGEAARNVSEQSDKTRDVFRHAFSQLAWFLCINKEFGVETRLRFTVSRSVLWPLHFSYHWQLFLVWQARRHLTCVSSSASAQCSLVYEASGFFKDRSCCTDSWSMQLNRLSLLLSLHFLFLGFGCSILLLILIFCKKCVSSGG